MRVVTLMLRSASQSRYQLIGCVALLAGFQFVLVAQATVIQESQTFGRIADLLPTFLQRGLGQQALLLATFQGIIAFGYFHPLVAVLVSVIGAYFATEPAYDVEAGRVDLLLARSVPRHRVITRSLALAFLATVLTVGWMALGTWTGLYVYASRQPDWPSVETIGRLILHLTAVAWLFSAFAAAVAAGSSRWTSAFSFVVGTIVVMYWIDFLAIAWPRMRALAWISPFDYYPGIPILGGTAPVWRNLLVLWSVTVLLWVVAYWRFQRRDL
jgi:ABC-type transport system involved in multi-copper enzyme maturation permease subunit